MARLGNIAIREYMRSVITEHFDPKTNEANLTTLAEDAMQHFGADESDADRFDDCAFDVGSPYEAAAKGHIRQGVAAWAIGHDAGFNRMP